MASCSPHYRNHKYHSVYGRNLVWTDFTGKPNYYSKFQAQIWWDIGYKLDTVYVLNNKGNILNGQANLMITTRPLMSYHSWVHTKFKTPFLLNHEQRHFDLAKIYARMLEDELPKPIQPSNWNKILDSLSRLTLKELDKIEKIYDIETDHGKITTMQEKWNKRIDSLILIQNLSYK